MDKAWDYLKDFATYYKVGLFVMAVGLLILGLLFGQAKVKNWLEHFPRKILTFFNFHLKSELKTISKSFYHHHGNPFAPSMRAEQKKDLEHLKARFNKNSDIFGNYPARPKLVPAGALNIEPEIKDAARQKNVPHNEPHGLLCGTPSWEITDDLKLSYRSTDYAVIQVLRDHKLKPPILSAGALLCCRDEQVLVVHKRSPNVSTFPSAWHVMGGNFKPAGDLHENDNDDLDRTITRELEEETNSSLQKEDLQIDHLPFTISIEKETGFVQITKLGVNISSKKLSELKGSKEGEVYVIPFAALPKILKDPHSWVPSGQMLVLWWLSQGAKINNGESAFASASQARGIYDEAMKEDLSESWAKK